MAKKTSRAAGTKKAATQTTAAKKPARSTKKKRPAAAKKSATAKKTPARRAKSAAGRKAKPAARSKSPVAKTTKRPKSKSSSKTAKSSSVRKTVDGYVSTLNDWRKECVGSLRKMIRQAAPKSKEKVKWSQPVYEHHGPFAWIKAHAKHVNLGFWRGVELPDPRKLLEGTGKKMRHIKLSNIKDAGKRELQEFVRVAAKLNEIKGNPTKSAKGKPKRKQK